VLRLAFLNLPTFSLHFTCPLSLDTTRHWLPTCTLAPFDSELTSSTNLDKMLRDLLVLLAWTSATLAATTCNTDLALYPYCIR
jgi:hypothetical protein